MNGSTLWYLQRFSSVLIFIYMLYISYFIFTSNIITFDLWALFTKTIGFKITSSLAFLTILIHAFIGLWTIGTDYLTSRTLGFLNITLAKIANSSRLAYNMLFSLMGVILYFYLLFLIWV